MRLLHLLSLIILLVPGLVTLAAQVPHDAREIETVAILEARDEPTNTSTTAVASDSETTATATTSGDSSSTTSSTTETGASTTISSLNASNTSHDHKKQTGSPKPGELPIKPSITPALGVGGFILIMIGAVLAFIGIRNLWVQVFLSASLLTSLGVTVLILYVMNPPVSNAIQGAYLIAVFFSGITFGALAIVFKELTEGLGCFLGGFCASMWLLCLKPGGLLTDINSKSGFIAGISVGFYALSFSQYTRPHGLIVSTAISGGTAVSLGIDCFSRAGLKEFWLYIWELNDSIFPLNTNTYPITRNIRVELAVTVIVALLGIVSQLRLWKMIRQRRRNEAKLREEERKKKDEADTEAGRQLEQTTMRERAEWEAKYGNGTDSKPTSSSTQEVDEKDRQNVDLEKGEGVDVKSVTATSQQSYRCSECREREANGDLDSEIASRAANDNHSITEHEAHESTLNQDPNTETEPPAPVFDGATAARIEDDNQSEVSAVIGSEAGAFSKRFSGMTMLQRDSMRSSMALVRERNDNAASNTSEEGVDGDSVLDSRRSSVYSAEGEVKLDSRGPEDKPVAEESKPHEDGPALKEGTTEQESPEERHSTEPDQKELDQTQDSKHEDSAKEQGEKTLRPEKATEQPDTSEHSEKDTSVGEQKQQENQTSQTEQQDQPATSVSNYSHDGPPASSYEAGEKPRVRDDSKVQTLAALYDDAVKSAEASQKHSASASSKGQGSHAEQQDARPPAESKSATESTKSKRSEERKSTPQKDKAKARAKKEKVILNEKTVKHLPERTSRVVLSYRTNEWAKHLDDAEMPEPPPIQPIEEEQPKVPVTNEVPPAPVNVKELLQTPLNAQPPPVERRVSFKELRNSNEGHRTSHESLQRQTDRPVSRSNSMANRPQTATVSPAYPDPPRPQPQPAQPAPPKEPKWKGPPPLLAVREDLMRNRVSSTSLSIDPWLRSSPRQSTFGPLSPTSPTSPTSPIIILPTPGEADDVPLSQRRAMLQQQQQQPTPPTPRALSPQAPLQRTRSGMSDKNAQAVMAAWRQSVREDLREKRDPLGMNSNPTNPTSPTSPAEHRSSYFGSQTPRNNSAVNLHIENAIAEGMQRGDMNDLHREAMRRMQASATRRA